MSEKYYESQFTLLNTALSPINFDLEFNRPFDIANLRSLNRMLRPREKQNVDVRFKLDLKLLNQMNNLKLIRPSPLANDQNRYFQLNDEIRLKFSNDIHQTVPVMARIYLPELKLDKHHLDFGKTLVGQQRCLQMLMRNPSKSSLLWRLKIDNDKLDTFETDLNFGFLEANKVYVSKSEQLINVFFTAK